jgi:hypothetical protein
MAKNNQVLVRLNDPQFDAFKEFAEDRDYNHAEASREIIKSRLAGEGYLQREHYDSPVADGGEVVEQIEKTQAQLQSQSEQIEQQEKTQKYLSITLIVSILWLISHIAFSVPSDSTVYSGIALLAGLITTYVLYLWG